MTGPGRTPAHSPEAETVEREVGRRITPSAEFLARVSQVRIALVERVTDAARARTSPLVRALIAGSAARGTFLQDRLDVDLFLLFPPDLSRDRLREEGLALGRAVLSNPETRYAEHPYLRGTFEGFTVDAVPGFAIRDPSHPLSPVDRTPFHQEYLASRETPELVDQVRLAKQFFRSLGVYGSEARTEGFSGYLVELLVIRFGSLRALLLAARDWRIPVRLAEPGKEPPRLPSDVALVLADPVDPNRNVASALSRRNLGLFILAAGAYLDRPSERFFEPAADPPLPKEAAARWSAPEGPTSRSRSCPAPTSWTTPSTRKCGRPRAPSPTSWPAPSSRSWGKPARRTRPRSSSRSSWPTPDGPRYGYKTDPPPGSTERATFSRSGRPRILRSSRGRMSAPTGASEWMPIEPSVTPRPFSSRRSPGFRSERT